MNNRKKKCTKCGREKLPNCFSVDRQKKSGRYSRCKVCVRNNPKHVGAKKKETCTRRRDTRPFEHAAYIANRRAKKEGLSDVITEKEWEEKARSKTLICHMCDKQTTLERGKDTTCSLDHVLPLSRGGRNLIENIEPACVSCNRSRSNMTMEEFKSWIRQVHSHLITTS